MKNNYYFKSKNILPIFVILILSVTSFAQNSAHWVKAEKIATVEYQTINLKNGQLPPPSELGFDEYLNFSNSVQSRSNPQTLNLSKDSYFSSQIGNTFIFVNQNTGQKTETFIGNESGFQVTNLNPDGVKIAINFNGRKTNVNISKNISIVQGRETNEFIAFRLGDVKNYFVTCSIADLVEDTINKRKSDYKRLCYQTGSPELKNQP